MRIFFLMSMLLLSGCSVAPYEPTVIEYTHCPVDVNEPQWYLDDQENGYYTSVVSVEYRPGIESEINDLVRVDLSRQVYTYIDTSITTMYTDRTKLPTKFKYSSTSASNMGLPHTRIQRYRQNNCMVAFGTLSPDDMREAIVRKERLDSMEREEWSKIYKSNNYNVFIHHIHRFPDGRYRDTALKRLRFLRDNPPTHFIR